MSTICNNGTNVPELENEICNGAYISTQCIVNIPALSYLNLPANSSQQVINNAFILALQYKDEQITQLIERIETLENI